MKRPHKELDVWKASMDLAVEVYSQTAALPVEERYGLVAQMRRCAVSIPSNLAEGAARRSKKEFNRFISIARGSLSELDSHLELCELLAFIPKARRGVIDDLVLRIDKMLHFLSASLSDKPTR